jgi:hypothetical protein
MTTDNKTGSVYVFNVFNETLTLSTNGNTVQAGDIPGWSDGATDKYRPNGIAVPRTLNATEGPGHFFNGTNQLTIQWVDGLFFAVVPLNGAAYPLIQDLLLFIDRTKWRLVNQYGSEVESGQVISATSLPDFARQPAKA